MKKILLLTDFSKVSEYAQEAAIILAKKHHAELILYHALKKGTKWIYELDSDPELIRYQHNQEASDISISKLRKELITKNIKSNLIIGSCELKQNFDALCLELQPDLVIIGAKGMDNTSENIGSTTKSLIKSSTKPVLIIKGPMRDKRIDEVVFASKFDLTDRDKFKQALKLLSLPKDATIDLMSVDTSSYFLQPTALMKSAMKDFEVIAYPIKARSNFYKDYNIEKGIQHFLGEVDPDILIMTHSDRNILKRIFQSDAALETAVSSTYPVLIIN